MILMFNVFLTVNCSHFLCESHSHIQKRPIRIPKLKLWFKFELNKFDTFFIDEILVL